MKLSFKGIFRDPNPKYKMLNHYSIYHGWWIEERTVTTNAIMPPDQLPPPEFRIYANLRHAKTQNFRGLVSGSKSDARKMIDDWGQRGYVVQHFLRDE